MKSIIVIVLFIFSLETFGQTKPVRIVFDVTSKDTVTHQSVLRHVKGMAKMYPEAMLEVVIYGGAWPMAVIGKSSSATAMEELSQNKNVSFKICGLTMQRYDVKSDDLVSGVEVVPDAIIEIVTRQGEGWGYIKESHN
jgi:intracellular sulfur oxidation DsrE/DsrF family protein